MTSPPLTPRCTAVLTAVAQAGALTTRRVIRAHAPKPAWLPLIEAGLVTPLATVRGETLVLSPLGHAHLKETGDTHDRVIGVERAVDRAYQNDVLEVLEREGYRVTHRHLQGGPLGHGRVVRYTLEVPPGQLEQLQEDWPTVHPAPRPGTFHEHLGRPSLYATCSRGGHSEKSVRELLERVHHRDLDVWRAPLIVVVPELTPELRRFLRRYDTRRTTDLDAQFGPGRLHGGRLRYGAIDLRVLP